MGKRKKSASDSDSEDSSDDKKKKKKKAESSSEEESDSSDESGSGSDSSSSDAKKTNKKGGKKNKKASKKKGKDKKAKKNKGKSKKDKKGKDKAKGKKAKKDKKAKEKAKDGSDDEDDEKGSAKGGSEGSEDGEVSKKKKKKKSKDAKKEGSDANDKDAEENEEEQSSDPEFEPQFTIHKGLSPGGDVFSSQTTVEKAKRKCAKIKELKGFSYQGEDTGEVMLIFFKDFSTKIFPSSDWTCFKLIDEKEKAKQAGEQSAAAGEAQDEDGDKEDEDADTTGKRGNEADELEKQAREREARALEAENREKELKAKWDAEQRQALLEKWEKERVEAREKAEKEEKEEKEESPKEEVKSEDESSKGDDDTGPAPAVAPEEIKPSKEELEKIEMERRKEELAEFQGSTEKADGAMILSMWKEDVHVNGHHSVWGSWYDADWGEWGYACCQQKERDAKCTGKKAAEKTGSSKFVNQDDIKELTSDSGESSGEDHADGEHRVVDFSNAPAELKPRSAFGGSSAGYIEHFLRYWVGVWRKETETNPKFDGYTDIEKAAFGGALPEVEKAVTPLIWRLRSGKTLERGEGKWKAKCRETRTGMDGKHVKEHSVLQSLDQMASFAAEQEYAKCNTTYTRLTFGNKMWNLTFVAHVSACTMKGAREYRRNRDSLNTYDADPVSQKYMHAMKKIVQFAQVKNPSEDMSKNVVM